MYLSRLILNPHSRRVQREVMEPYEMHRSLMRAFPTQLERQVERVLFRLDTRLKNGGLVLLVQSLNRPDWSWLAEPAASGYLLPLNEPNPAVKPFNPTFSPGQLLAFRLRANPTVKRCHGDPANPDKEVNKRIGLYREEEQLSWLRRKAAAGGFEVLQVRIRQEGLVRGAIHRDGGESHTLRLLAVTFDGLLRVTNVPRFVETLQAGIGSGKGLGFGLLSLARPVQQS